MVSLSFFFLVFGEIQSQHHPVSSLRLDGHIDARLSRVSSRVTASQVSRP